MINLGCKTLQTLFFDVLEALLPDTSILFFRNEHFRGFWQNTGAKMFLWKTIWSSKEKSSSRPAELPRWPSIQRIISANSADRLRSIPASSDAIGSSKKPRFWTTRPGSILRQQRSPTGPLKISQKSLQNLRSRKLQFLKMPHRPFHIQKMNVRLSHSSKRSLSLRHAL